MNTTAMIAAVFNPIAKALQGRSRHLPTRMNRAARDAHRRRCELVQQLSTPGWRAVPPTRPNAPAFIARPDACVRVLRRTPHARTGRYSFTLGHRSAPEPMGYALICEDPQNGQSYVVLAHAGDHFPPYLSLSVEEAQTHAVLVLPLTV